MMRYLFSFLFIFILFLQSSNADSAINDTCNGEIISELHSISGIFSNVSHTETGTVNDHNTVGTDKFDYYYFKTDYNGTIAIDYNSTENTDLKISTVACDGTDILNGSNADTENVTFTIGSNTTVYIRVEPRKTYDQAYNIGITFTKATTPLCVNTGNSNAHREFCLRKRLTVQGGMKTIGNTLLVPPTGQISDGTTNVCAGYTNGAYITDVTTNNNHWYMCKYEKDAGTTTSSQAELNIPSTSTIEWAGLYWQALILKGNEANITSMSPDIKKNSGVYYDISGYDQLDWLADDGKTDYTNYAAFKDVTQLFLDHNWTDGNYTVANIPVVEGQIDNLGTFGAWSLVVIYSDDSGVFKNFSIFDGYKVVKNVAGYQDVKIPVDGFYTPKTGSIDSEVSIFVGEGDKYVEGDHLQAINTSGTTVNIPASTQTFNSSISGGGTRVPSLTNNNGIDIQTHDVGTSSGYNILTNEQTSLEFHFTSTGDTYWPSMIAFETDIHVPQLCYDYAYSQDGFDFTEDNNGSINITPHISGTLATANPVFTKLFVRNNEEGSLANNVVLRISDLNSTRIAFPLSTADLNLSKTEPDGIVFTPVTTFNVHNASNIEFLYANLLNFQQGVYSQFYLQPSASGAINVPLNMYLDFNFTIQNQSFNINNLPLKDKVPLCTTGGYSYQPAFGAFNVVQQNAYLGSSVYDIPTQVAERVDNFLVLAHDTTDATTINNELNVTTIVSVELIDVGSFHDATIACNDPGNSITPRVWVTFENNVSRVNFNKTTIDNAIALGMVSDQIANDPNPITSAEEFFSHAVRNTAFRVNYNAVNDDGELVQLEPISGASGTHYNVTNFPDVVKLGECLNDVDGNLNNTDTVATFCSNAGSPYPSAMSPAELAVCMECVYGYSVKSECSRDNFSIRPEAFKVSLYDSDQSTISTDPNTDISSSYWTPNLGTVAYSLHLSAGYNYRYDVNATTHSGNNAVQGYTQSYISTQPTYDHYAVSIWNPEAGHIAADPVNNGCNDDSNVSISLYMTDGQALNFMNRIPNVGRYALLMRDTSWTTVDQNPSHQTAPHYTPGSDCTINQSFVPDSATPLTSANVGCTISSEHINNDAGITYLDHNITVHPYDFNLSTVTFNKGINNTILTGTHEYAYLNDISIPNDYNMSIRYSGFIQAVSAQLSAPLSNFVANCYAENIDLDLNTSDLPVTPLFNYRLIERNATTAMNNNLISDINGTNAGLTLLPSVTIPASRFTKDLLGQSRMEFNVNFDRNITGPVNPISLIYDQFGVSCTTPANCQSFAHFNPVHVPDTNLSTDINVTHIYGRLHTPRQRVADTDPGTQAATATIPLYYEFYCNSITGCNINDYTTTPALAPDRLLSQDDVRWYVQDLHNVVIDGNATATQTRNNVNDLRFNNGADMNIDADARTATYTYDGSQGYPYKVTIELGTQNWLLYNRYNINATENEFELEFFTAGQWSGRDESQMGLDANSSTNVNRRISW